MPSIDDRFLAQHPRSAELHAEAARVLPGGITHDIRYFDPFGLRIERAQGARKWDVDGNEIVDYVMGHGALLFGHAHPLMVETVQAQITRGTHYGSSHPAELAWGQAVQRLLPSAERVRFTSSGTEATMMAVRLARAATGRPKLLKLRSHFHGWNDSVAAGAQTSAGVLKTNGLLRALSEAVTVVDQTDVEAMAGALASREYAAAILEPTGYSWGTCPLPASVPLALRELTEESETVLIFDEVVTGFRVAPGGAQERLGIRPDLTTLAKVLAGGLPGGAVAGRAALVDQIGAHRNGDAVAHPGTFNANPLSASVGARMLTAVADGDPVGVAARQARRLCEGFNAALRDAEVPGAAYGDASLIRIVLGPDVPRPAGGMTWEWGEAGAQPTMPPTPAEIMWPFRRALLNHGVDLIGMGAIVSCVHDDRDIDDSIEAFGAALSDLRADGVL